MKNKSTIHILTFILFTISHTNAFPQASSESQISELQVGENRLLLQTYVHALTCTAPCTTCSGTSTNCTSCNITNKRVLSSSQCICQYGFTNSSADNCTQICGDGQILSNDTQCDDGNKISGDGCSSTCQIELGFNCTNNKSQYPESACISKNGYTIDSELDYTNFFDHIMYLRIWFYPTPPRLTKFSIINYIKELQYYSYYGSYSYSNTMLISLKLLQDIQGSDPILIYFPQINQTISIPLVVKDNRQLKLYTRFQIRLFTTIFVLVCLYLACLWVGAYVLLVINPSAFSSILELFMFTGLTWVGVQGQQKITYLFSFLGELKYIFGPNFKFMKKQTLFNVINTGPMLFVIPLIAYGVIQLLKCVRKNYTISKKIEKFIVIDLFYGWLMINGLLVAKGLGLITKLTELSMIDYGGILFGVIYLLVVLFMSYRMFFAKQELEINPNLQITKKNINRPRLYAAVNISYILVSFAYISISKFVKLNSILMLVFLLLIFILFSFGNILKNKKKYMINLTIQLLIYGVILLFNINKSFVWCALAITILLFVQLAINFIIMFLERNENRLVQEAQKETQVVHLQNENSVKRAQYRSVLQGYFQNNFTAYEPIIKKPGFENGAVLQALHDKKSIMKTLKTLSNVTNFQENRPVKQNSMLNEQFLETESQPKKQAKSRQQTDLIEIGSREVPMDAI